MSEYNDMFILSNKHYYGEIFSKKQIVIGNSISTNMGHIKRWEKRLNGESKNTSPFTISLDGTIYQHYNPAYYSNFINIGHLDRHIIGITLENEGALWKNDDNKKYINWIGYIYSRKNKVVDTKWKNRQYWAPYNVKQINSLIKLCHKLCDDFSIPKECFANNTENFGLMQNFSGIAFRSNYSKHFFDVSPAFDIDSFKNKIEK